MSTDSVEEAEGLEELAMTVHEQNGPVARVEQRAITPAQAKVDAVANLTMKAYERASTLDLTEQEIVALTAEFPDEAFKPGAAGKEHLIYIEHAFLRDRLNQVFGPGQWAVIPRSRWAEEFKTNKGTDGSRIYVEAMLLIRGCFVAEAVGAMEYYPGNAAQNYGDAVEGAKTAALRRCAKELGVGLQAWKKDFCDGWWERRRGNRTPPPTRGHRQQPSRPITEKELADPQNMPPEDDLPFEGATAPKPAPQGNSGDMKPKSAPNQATAPNSGGLVATLEQQKRLLEALKAEGPDAEMRARMYFIDIGALGAIDRLETLPLRFVPRMASQMRELGERIAALANTGKAEKCIWMAVDDPVTKAPVAPATAQPAARVPRDDEAWRDAIIPIPRKGQKRADYMTNPDTIGSLYDARHGTDDNAAECRQRLFGFLNSWEPTGWTKRDGTKMPPSSEDVKCRAALDQFGEWFEKHHPGEKI